MDEGFDAEGDPMPVAQRDNGRRVRGVPVPQFNIIDREELLQEAAPGERGAPAPLDEADEYMHEPLGGHQWIPRDSAGPVPWCYMCHMQVDPSNPHYLLLRRWADTPIGDMRFIVANMARTYEREIRRAGTAPLPAWPRDVIWRHLHEHEISPVRVAREAFSVLTAKVDDFVALGRRKRMRSDGTNELCASDPQQDNMLLKYIAARARVAADYHAHSGRREGET